MQAAVDVDNETIENDHDNYADHDDDDDDDHDDDDDKYDAGMIRDQVRKSAAGNGNANNCGGGDNDDTPVRTGDIRAAVVLGALALVDGNETDWKIIVAGVEELKRLAAIAADLECRQHRDPAELAYSAVTSAAAATAATRIRVPTDLHDVPVEILNRVHTFFRDYKTADGRTQLEFGVVSPRGQRDWVVGAGARDKNNSTTAAGAGNAGGDVHQDEAMDLEEEKHWIGAEQAMEVLSHAQSRYWALREGCLGGGYYLPECNDTNTDTSDASHNRTTA